MVINTKRPRRGIPAIITARTRHNLSGKLETSTPRLNYCGKRRTCRKLPEWPVHLADETGGRFFDDMNKLAGSEGVLDLEKGYYLIGYQLKPNFQRQEVQQDRK